MKQNKVQPYSPQRQMIPAKRFLLKLFLAASNYASILLNSSDKAMFWFKKKSKENAIAHDSAVDRRSIESTLKNDLLGMEDFKNSKIGFLTGLPALGRALSGVGESASNAGGRLKSTYSSLTESEKSIPELQLDGREIDPHHRFADSVKLHKLRDADLLRITRNTFRIGWMYFGFSVISALVSIATFFFWPPQGLYSAIVRFGPLPLFLALTFKSFYANWLVRHRILTGPKEFFTSFDWFPKNIL